MNATVSWDAPSELAPGDEELAELEGAVPLDGADGLHPELSPASSSAQSVAVVGAQAAAPERSTCRENGAGKVWRVVRMCDYLDLRPSARQAKEKSASRCAAHRATRLSGLCRKLPRKLCRARDFDKDSDNDSDEGM